MCSCGVWVVSWVLVCKKVSCTCRGLLAKRRANWVSVTILVGIRFKISLRTLLVHDKHVLARKFAIGGQLFGNDQRHKQ